MGILNNPRGEYRPSLYELLGHGFMFWQNRLETAANFSAATIRGEVTAGFIHLADKRETCFCLNCSEIDILAPGAPRLFGV